VAVRLPSFWPERPALWFAQAEAQFELAGITSERTKYSHVISHLDHRYAAEVEDIITSPLERDQYTTLKAELVRRLSVSRDQRVRQLFMHEEMGDRKPSQFLRHLKSLAPDDFLRSIWSNRLPPHIQAILAGQSEVGLDAASHLADRICEVTPQPTIASVDPAPDHTELLQRIEDLSRQVASLSAGRIRRRSCSRGRHPCSTPPSEDTPTAQILCGYHRRIGAKAQKCTQPCSFRQQGN
jgi:hypothetical protein